MRTYDQSLSVPTFTVGAVAGVLVGSGIALLVAPHSGRTLRRRLRRYCLRATEDTLEMGQGAFERAREWGHEYLEIGMDGLRKMVRRSGIGRLIV
jgi:gas vesicle protein